MAKAGLMDSLTNTITGNVTDTAKEMASSVVENASNEVIKKALDALDIREGGSNKQAIKDRLGVPVEIKNDAGLEVWVYDVATLNKISPMMAEASKALFKESEFDQKWSSLNLMMKLLKL